MSVADCERSSHLEEGTTGSCACGSVKILRPPCRAAANQRGAHIPCDTPGAHDVHGNTEHELIWRAS